MSQQFARRRFLGFTKIENALQVRHMTRVVICASVYVVVSTIIFTLFYVSRLAGTADDAQRLTMGWVLSMSGMSVLFAILVGLYLTRRIAGPIHRMKCDLRQFLDGDDRIRVRLRGRDEMADLADLINRVLEVGSRAEASEASPGASELRTELQKVLEELKSPGMAAGEGVETLVERLEALASPAFSRSA